MKKFQSLVINFLVIQIIVNKEKLDKYLILFLKLYPQLLSIQINASIDQFSFSHFLSVTETILLALITMCFYTSMYFNQCIFTFIIILSVLFSGGDNELLWVLQIEHCGFKGNQG